MTCFTEGFNLGLPMSSLQLPIYTTTSHNNNNNNAGVSPGRKDIRRVANRMRT